MKTKNDMATARQHYPTVTRTRDSTSMENDTEMGRIASKTAPNTSANTLKAKSTAKALFGTPTARATRVAGLKIAEMAMGSTTT